MSPPTITIANGRWLCEPMPVDIAAGIRPATATAVVRYPEIASVRLKRDERIGLRRRDHYARQGHDDRDGSAAPHARQAHGHNGGLTAATADNRQTTRNS